MSAKANWIVVVKNYDDDEWHLYGPMTEAVAERRAQNLDDWFHRIDDATDYTAHAMNLVRWSTAEAKEWADAARDDKAHREEQWAERMEGAGL